MDTATFLALVLACAPQVHPDTARALVQVESNFNPWAIGVVRGALDRQPLNRTQALATAQALRRAGWNFSVGLAQINVANVDRLGLGLEDAFEPCTNLAAMQRVLRDCFERAAFVPTDAPSAQTALRHALSCYYSGNFRTGVQQGYVRHLTRAALALSHRYAPVAPKESP